MFQGHTKAAFISICSVPPSFWVCGRNTTLGDEQTQCGELLPGQSGCAGLWPCLLCCQGWSLPDSHIKNREHLKARPVRGGLQTGELQGLLMPSLLQSIARCPAMEQKRLERCKITRCVTPADPWTQHWGNWRDLPLCPGLQQPRCGEAVGRSTNLLLARPLMDPEAGETESRELPYARRWVEAGVQRHPGVGCAQLLGRCRKIIPSVGCGRPRKGCQAPYKAAEGCFIFIIVKHRAWKHQGTSWDSRANTPRLIWKVHPLDQTRKKFTVPNILTLIPDRKSDLGCNLHSMSHDFI